MVGVGFGGSGVILRDSDMKSVHGLTTAATIWIAAALGITCGAGYWPIVLGATALTLLVLTGRQEARALPNARARRGPVGPSDRSRGRTADRGFVKLLGGVGVPRLPIGAWR